MVFSGGNDAISFLTQYQRAVACGNPHSLVDKDTPREVRHGKAISHHGTRPWIASLTLAMTGTSR
jgi:hypothetical protein